LWNVSGCIVVVELNDVVSVRNVTPSGTERNICTAVFKFINDELCYVSEFTKFNNEYMDIINYSESFRRAIDITM
jgi:hypothetical protein